MRDNGILIFILMFSVKVEDNDKIMGFLIGVDDYMVKLFNLLEFFVCVKVILRRM